MLSWIQYHILTELTRHQVRRYSDLRPADVEGNLFTYHLNGLLKDGFVEKAERHYRLSAKGLQFASTLSLKTGRTRKQPKVVAAIVAKNDNGEYLFSRWSRQPNAGRVSFPYGMVHFGEALFAMAARELAEKASLEAVMEYMGDVYIRAMRGAEVDRHMLVHLFQAQQLQPVALEKEVHTRASEPFWAPLDAIASTEFVPGFFELANIVTAHSQGSIFQDIEVSIP